MADTKKGQKPQQRGQGGRNQQSNRPPRRDRKKEAIGLIERGEGVAIKRTTTTTQIYATMLQSQDHFMGRITRNSGLGIKSSTNLPKGALEYAQYKQYAIMLHLNELNHLLADMAGDTYTPPKNFDDSMTLAEVNEWLEKNKIELKPAPAPAPAAKPAAPAAPKAQAKAPKAAAGKEAPASA